MKYKVGDKVRVVRGWGVLNGQVFTVDRTKDGCLKVYDGTGLIIWIPFQDLELVERTIEDVQEGDLITDGERFRRVLGRNGQAVFTTSIWSKGMVEEKCAAPFFFSIFDLKEGGYTIVTESTPEVKEMTVADVEKLVGTKVKIVK